jgi:lysophospholipase L1-like esterase
VNEFRRYVAIGDSSTEGLEDPDGQGGYRGWADRLAEHIADAQQTPLEYGNLAIRGLRLHEIRTTQFDAALALDPDLMTIFGGVNDALAVRCDFTSMRSDFVAMFSEARERGITVLTFTMVDPSKINRLSRQLRSRMFMLNDLIREIARCFGVRVVDFQRYSIAEDPRLWYEDRLHGNSLCHQLMAAALAWRLGLEGFDESWASALPDEPTRLGAREQISGDLDWAVRYLAPWVGKGIRRIPHGYGRECKRPIPTVMPKRASSTRQGHALLPGQSARQSKFDS